MLFFQKYEKKLVEITTYFSINGQGGGDFINIFTSKVGLLERGAKWREYGIVKCSGKQ